MDKASVETGEPEFYCNEGEKLLAAQRPEAALELFEKAVRLDARSAHGWFGQGMAYMNMEEYAESLDYFRKVIRLSPKVAEAHHNLGRALHEIGQADLAYQSFNRAIQLNSPVTRKDVAIMVPGVPSADNRRVLLDRRKWAHGISRSADLAADDHVRPRDREKQCLKIGYVSAFFHKENWMKPVWGLVGQHDRERFQIHLFSDRTELSPAIEKCLEEGDQFHDMSGLSNTAAAELVDSQEIDILVDLNGYSYPPRLPLFLRKPAPLIVGWFNMYATTGFDCFDYLVGDDCVIPRDEEQYYSEKIVRVDGSYLTFTVGYHVPDVVAPPCIENGHITFGSLISQYKISDKVIKTWCKILKQAPGSRLLLRNTTLGMASNRNYLLSEFRKRGLNEDRLVLLGPADHYEFLQTYDQIDIALDAFPYNGGTTTTEAIWQGVPVVTWWGDRWVSRTSATLLRSAGLGELVANNVSDYVRLAVELAGDVEKLSSMRRTMRDKLLASDVCDTAVFARSMEKLYRGIWEGS